MKIKILGTGTSTGIPIPGCNCKVCLSDDPFNKRLRCSIYLEFEPTDIDPDSQTDLAKSSSEILGSCLVDTSTDLRQQALKFQVTDVQSVLYTHAHADHCHGIDDLRVFNFIHGNRIPVYGSPSVTSELSSKFSYVFHDDPSYQGGATAKLDLFPLEAGEAFSLFGVEILPIPILHGNQEIFGYRFGDFAYLTDCSSIPKSSYAYLQNLKILIIDGLRYKPHPTHLTLDQAIAEVEKIEPENAWLTHISHDVDHEEGNTYLQNNSKRSIELAWDGLELRL